MTGPTFIVEWFRPDRTRRIKQVCAVAASVLATGALTVGLARSADLSESQRLLIGVIGGVCTAGGPLYCVLALWRVIGPDIYLALRSDGVFFHSPAGELLVRWDVLTQARAEAEGRLVLGTDDGDQRIDDHFMDVTTQELARRINRTQQKALMGLLRLDPPPPSGGGSGP